ncbi:putative bifunctional diguanylate cyclase/phosphodiesterase [Shewanella basaltis]|uniref:putative bifunctional diguanylate cyclase/phosphodiesterase n=1 Tax=Shewanella basaltis TaxID=472183 RepID=UPI003AAFE697
MQLSDPQILHDHLKLLYRSAIPGIAITLVASAGLAFGFEDHSGKHYKLLWWLSLSALIVCRSVDTYLWFKRTNNGAISRISDLYRFSSGVLLTAVFWAFYCLFIYDKAEITELFTALVTVSAMAGGAATILSGHKRLSQIYTLLLVLPISLQIIYSGNDAYLLLGMLGIAYAFVMFSVAQTAAQFTEHSIMLRNEHNVLLKTMEEMVEQRTKKIIELSQRDPLTQLLNRRAFIERANQHLAQTDPDNQYAIFFLDLDGFKQANDSFGHGVGDEVLSQVAQRIETACQHGEIICRWGGDEFIILAHQTKDYRFEELAIMLKKQINLPIVTAQHVIHMDCSIGVAKYPEHGQSLSDLISLADLSMYSRKGTSNDDFVMFSDELEQKIKREIYLSKAIMQAVEKNQLRLVFQPIIQSNSGEIASVEALLRWDFEGAMVSPDTFIPLAQKNGAIKDIGYWVMNEAVQKLAQLQTHHGAIKMSVNVSVIQFEDIHFVDKVYDIVVQHNVSPSDLHIEITESVFSKNKLALISMVKAFQTLGFLISIDDFGTGYSSLSVIQDLHVNIVKIDRSFVINLHLKGIDIVKAVMVMSHGLNYRIVAEGVETRQQASTLTTLGIHYLQGYLFDKPLEFDVLLDRLMQQSNQQQAPTLLYSANS